MKWLKKFASILLQLSFMIVLPFILIIRGSVYLYEHHNWNHWLSMIVMFAIAFVLLLIYTVMIYDWLFGENKVSRKGLKVQSIIVMSILLLYGGYTLINLSGANAKTPQVREEFTSLHPLLRMSVGTVLFLDQKLLVTDMSRGKEDYKKMGLKTLKHSLHYPQKDGYVHAMDLRTNDRSEIRNRLLQFYFWSMGFNTLRHVGTADHLHISLTSRDNPASI
ncbi:MAG: hypothetical protein KDE26_02670 [Bacteroidetes bacterium]|nr:hypothetical protein [Bacteroidota bacterium]